MTKVVSIGLDGAAWHKLDRLIGDGRLPNLSALVEEGARGPLRSVKPPVTCPAWRCSTSGKNPGKLGVFWWLTLNRDSGEFFHPDANSFESADIWDYLSEENYRSAILNVPMTYPPSELDGTMVSGFGAPLTDQKRDDEPITYPKSFQKQLYEEYDWQVEVDDLAASDGAEQAYQVMESRFELLLDLLSEDYDYYHLTIFYINMLQHKYGDSEITAKGWELIDEYLGRLREEDALLVIYSDHGHTNIDNTFVVNRWLDAKGYLTFKGEDETTTEGGRLTEILRRAGKGAKRRLPGTVTDAVRPLYRRIVPPEYPSSVEVAESIDWDNSVAAATSQGPIYLNRDVLGDDYESVRSELKSELESLTHDGDTLLSSVKDAEEVYSGRHSDDAPDLIATAKEGWEIYGGLADSVFVTQATSWTSGNHPSGIVLFAGDGVESMELPERSILDVMPTVLSYMDCPIPEDVDGSVIEEPFENELSTEKMRPAIQPNDSQSSADEAQIKESLKDLGYLE